MFRITHKQLAKKAGVSRSSVTRFLQQKVNNEKTRRRILSVLKISPFEEAEFFKQLKLQAKTTEKYREKQRRAVIKYLRAHPRSTKRDVDEAGLKTSLLEGFRGKMQRARKDAGVPLRKRRSRDFRRKRIIHYLKTHPEATITAIRRDGYEQDLFTAFRGRVSTARLAAGLRSNEPEERRRERFARPREKAKFLTWLKKHPTATPAEIRMAGLHPQLRYFFRGRISKARKAAGLTHPGHLSAAGAGRILGISRESARNLFHAGVLKGFRQGKFIYVTKQSVLKQKLLKQLAKLKPAMGKP